MKRARRAVEQELLVLAVPRKCTHELRSVYRPLPLQSSTRGGEDGGVGWGATLERTSASSPASRMRQRYSAPDGCLRTFHFLLLSQIVLSSLIWFSTHLLGPVQTPLHSCAELIITDHCNAPLSIFIWTRRNINAALHFTFTLFPELSAAEERRLNQFGTVNSAHEWLTASEPRGVATTKGGVTLVNLQHQLATPIRNACFSHEFADMLHLVNLLNNLLNSFHVSAVRAM